jgi:hypothetical protein
MMGQGLEQSRTRSRFFDGSQQAEQPAIINQEFMFLIENVQLGVVFLAGKDVADFLLKLELPDASSVGQAVDPDFCAIIVMGIDSTLVHQYI